MELVTVSVVLIQNVARMGHVFQIQCIIRRQNVAIVTTGIPSQFRIADAFPGNPMYCLTLVCKTEWNMKDYTLPSAVGFCWCWWRGGGGSSCGHPVVTLQPERYNIFPLHISQYDVSSNITQPLEDFFTTAHHVQQWGRLANSKPCLWFPWYTHTVANNPLPSGVPASGQQGTIVAYYRVFSSIHVGNQKWKQDSILSSS
jgi:hypothetical protein